MESMARIWFTARQKAELWERWKSVQCVADIARALDGRPRNLNKKRRIGPKRRLAESPDTCHSAGLEPSEISPAAAIPEPAAKYISR